MVGQILGHYRIEEKLGEGGMGVVYRARDLHLDRLVAIKVLRPDATANPERRKRFVREAKSASALNHPNIITIYDIDQHDGRDYIAMEYIAGKALDRLIGHRGLPLGEVLRYANPIADALAAAHEAGIVHRDLKPGNIMVTQKGQIKLLDFGLAKLTERAEPGTDAPTETIGLQTEEGAIVGTVAYMSPEQAEGKKVDARSDIFSFGSVLFEMMTGRRPFTGDSWLSILTKILNEDPMPPEQCGTSIPPELEKIVLRCLRKAPARRYQTMADLKVALEDLEEEPGPGKQGPQALLRRRMARLMVLPFRILRPDADTDFLGFSLPDAVTSSLSGLSSLVVRSSLAASRFGGPSPDLKAIATDADVDFVLTGTLLRGGDQIRVSTQLVEAPSGTLIWSQTAQVSLGDIFQFQDDVVQGIVDSLSLSLTAREHCMLRHDVPASATAYEFYLRANQVALDYRSVEVARDLYSRCLELDPQYAPAWARLGRCHWMLAKWGEAPETHFPRAEEAFRRGFDLNPDLSVAHNLYAHLEADLGRARQGMIRLLRRAQVAGNDPNLFAGLVHLCRYCGLLEASLAAHEQARRIDPQIRTSVAHTCFMLGDYRRVLEAAGADLGYVGPAALVLMGRAQEALALAREAEARMPPSELLRDLAIAQRAMLEGDRDESLRALERLLAKKFCDLEGLYYWARMLAQLKERQRALKALGRAVDQGYCCFPAMERDPWLKPLRAAPEFAAILGRAEQRYQEACSAFQEAGGEGVLRALPVS